MCIKCGAWKGQLGLEPTPFLYVGHIVMVCREIKRVLKNTGSVYVVLGDTYAGSCSQGSQSKSQPYLRLYPQRKVLQPKCLIGIPWRVAVALIDDDWVLRNAIIWHKPNAMPSSVKDRLTCTYETIFHFVKNRKYYYDLDTIREPHKTAFAPFNLRVRDVKRGKGGISTFGELKASKEEVEKYVYPESKLTKHDLAVGRVGNVNYTDPLHTKRFHSKGKNPGDVIKAKWSNVSGQSTQSNFGHGGTHGNRFNHPLGKNPGDVFQAKKKPYIGNNPHRMRLHKNCYAPLNPERPEDLSHPLGKNPGDVISERVRANLKHFIPSGSGGHYAFGGLDSKEAKHYAERGRNPGDIVKAYTVRHKSWMSKPGHPYTHKRVWTPEQREAIGDFWSISTKPFKGAHFAVYPEEICVKPIKSSCPPGGIVLDPMCGSGTTLVVAKKLGMNYIGFDINPNYVEMAKKRLSEIYN